MSLFDRHGLSLRPWAQRGYDCVAFNPDPPLATCKGVVMRTVPMATAEQIRASLPPADEIAFVVASPPCRDLCAAGARWWRRKSARNPFFQQDAVRKLTELYAVLEGLRAVPFVLLLPASPRIKTLFRAPDFQFSPHEYGGYLDRNAPHPLFPETVPTQDRYTKKTFGFTSNRAVQPLKRPSVPVFTEIRLKSGIIKRVSPILASRRNHEARHVTPLGFATAICDAHATREPCL